MRRLLAVILLLCLVAVAMGQSFSLWLPDGSGGVRPIGERPVRIQAATSDPRIAFRTGATPASRFVLGTDYESDRFTIASTDTLWTTYDANIIASGMWPSVLIVDSTYHMYYVYGTGFSDYKIGHATSDDGKTWTIDSENNPVLEGAGGGEWDAGWVYVPQVWKEGATWHMMYGGGDDGVTNEQIGHATSSDGLTWSRDEANPVYAHGDPGEWDAATVHKDVHGVIKVGSTYYMFITTSSHGNPAIREVGVASSTDLANWTPDANNPIFADNYYYCPGIFKYDGTYYLVIDRRTGTADSVRLYSCPNPTFHADERTYVKTVITESSFGVTTLDTPFVLTDDINRDSFPDDELWCYCCATSVDYIGLTTETDIAAAVAAPSPAIGTDDVFAIDQDGNLNICRGGYIYGDTTNPFVRLNYTAGTYVGYDDQYWKATGSVHAWYQGGSERMHIDQNGNFGVGITGTGVFYDVQVPSGHDESSDFHFKFINRQSGTSAHLRGMLVQAGGHSSTRPAFEVQDHDGNRDFTVYGDGVTDVANNHKVGGVRSTSVDADTIADNGNGVAAHTLTPTTSYVELTCNDADGANITMGESGIVEGAEVTIVNVSANVCNFADTAGVSELAGAFAMGQYDTLKLIYLGDRWAEVGRSDN